MKFVVILLILLVPICAFARIGETAEECVTRYGKAIDKVDNRMFFAKGGFVIAATFYQGVVDSIAYFKEGKRAEISDNEIEVLLKSNGGDEKWEKLKIISVDKQWETEDGAIMACYKTFDNMLLIATKERLERMIAEKKAEEKERLEEF